MDGRGGRSEEDGGLEGGGEGREREREPRARKTSEQFKLPFQVVTLFMRTKIIRWAGGGEGRGAMYMHILSPFTTRSSCRCPQAGWRAATRLAFIIFHQIHHRSS